MNKVISDIELIVRFPGVIMLLVCLNRHQQLDQQQLKRNAEEVLKSAGALESQIARVVSYYA